MPSIKVTLLRRDGEPPKVYEHSEDKSALRRAKALADLHSSEVQTVEGGYLVDARHYYKPKQ